MVTCDKCLGTVGSIQSSGTWLFSIVVGIAGGSQVSEGKSSFLSHIEGSLTKEAFTAELLVRGKRPLQGPSERCWPENVKIPITTTITTLALSTLSCEQLAHICQPKPCFFFFPLKR